MDIVHGDAVAVEIIPQREHAAGYLWVLLFEFRVAEVCGCPVLIDIVVGKNVVIVVGQRYGVDGPVGHADHVPSVSLHVFCLGHERRPHTEDGTFRIDGCPAVCVAQRSPEDGCLAVFLDELKIMAGVGAELLAQLFRSVVILIGTDVYIFPAEDRILS